LSSWEIFAAQELSPADLAAQAAAVSCQRSVFPPWRLAISRRMLVYLSYMPAIANTNRGKNASFGDISIHKAIAEKANAAIQAA
jgi:hypothetical protein